MRTEFRKGRTADEIGSLLVFDRKVFSAADRFPADYGTRVQSYWMLIDGVQVGCSAFERHVYFRQDQREDERKPHLPGSLYIASTGTPRVPGTRIRQAAEELANRVRLAQIQS